MAVESCLQRVAEMVRSITTGIPSFSAAVIVNGMKASETMQVTGGLTSGVAVLRLLRRSENGGNMFFEMESKREVTSWLALESERGRPSGMVRKRKSGKPSKLKEPPAAMDLMRRRWLKSVLTKVM